VYQLRSHSIGNTFYPLRFLHEVSLLGYFPGTEYAVMATANY
jgi:hypothetical protein